MVLSLECRSQEAHHTAQRGRPVLRGTSRTIAFAFPRTIDSPNIADPAQFANAIWYRHTRPPPPWFGSQDGFRGGRIPSSPAEAGTPAQHGIGDSSVACQGRSQLATNGTHRETAPRHASTHKALARQPCGGQSGAHPCSRGTEGPGTGDSVEHYGFRRCTKLSEC